MPPKKRFLSLKEKIEIIEVYNKERLSARALAKEFNIGKSQAAEIIKNKDKLVVRWQFGGNEDAKRAFLRVEGLNIDNAVYDWFVKTRNKNIWVSGPMIRSKAKEVAESLGYHKFQASSGWLEKFNIRHKIKFRNTPEEEASTDQENIVCFFQQIPSLLKEYDPKNIFNADETCLFYRDLPTTTLAFKGEKCGGGKMAKDRITILHCVSMCGEKEPLVVVGRSARPRAFKNIELEDLPVEWKHNRKAWMTYNIMHEWLQKLDKKMCTQKRNILLFLGNACSRPREIELKHIKIYFLPPNYTGFGQPIDQGIRKNFKMFYRSLLFNHILTKIDIVTSTNELLDSIDLLDVIFFIKTAWAQISSITVQNCFKKAGFCSLPNESTDHKIDEDYNLPLPVMAGMQKGIKPTSNSNSEELINFDEDLDEDYKLQKAIEATGDSDHEEFINIDEDSDDENSDESNIKNENEANISYQQALQLTAQLKNFARHQNDCTAFDLVSSLEMHLSNPETRKNYRQTTILSFFNNT